jgi:O-antigen/teichoic acid export membrane protein
MSERDSAEPVDGNAAGPGSSFRFTRNLPPWSMAGSDFVRNVGQTMAARMFTIATGSVTTIVVARLLGPSGRGQYATAGAIAAVGVSLAALGLQSSNTYFVARDRSLLAPLLGNTLLTGLAGTSLLVALVGIGLELSGRLSLGSLLPLALVAIPVGIAYLLLQNLLLGLRDIGGYNLIEICTRLLGVTLLGALAAAGFVRPSSAFATGVVASAAAAAWSLSRLRRHLGEMRPTVSAQLFLVTMRYGVRAYLAALFAFLLLRSDIFVVRYQLGSAQAGIYSVAVSLADLLYILPTVVGTMLFPRLSGIRDRSRQWDTSIRVAAVVFVIMTIAAAIAWPLSHRVVVTLFGESFAHAGPAFAILAAAMVFYGVNNIISNYAAARAFPAFAIWVWLVGLALNVGLNLLLVPRYGISGSAFASLVAYALVAMAQLGYFAMEARARQA